MPYMGSFVQAAGYTLEVVTLSKVSVTIVNIRRDRISEIDLSVFDGTSGSSPPPVQKTIGSNIGRVVLIANALIGETAKVKVTSAGNLFEYTINPDGDLVFDVV